MQKLFRKACFFLFIAASLLFVSPSFSNSSGLPLPRFVSLRSDEVNLRRGPGTQYRIDWVFVRANLPVQIISEFETWRKVRDIEGAEGWVHQSMLSGKRTVMIPLFQDPVTLQKHPDSKAHAVAYIQGGVIGRLKKCKKNWCLLIFQDHEGWLQKKDFWGLQEGEVIK